MTDHTQPKRCTCCGQVKAPEEFYLRSKSKPDGPRRSRCKSCMVAADLRRYYKRPSILSEIALHAADPDAPISKDAEEAIYSNKPLDPELVRRYQLRADARAWEARRRERLRENEFGKRPIRFTVGAA